MIVFKSKYQRWTIAVGLLTFLLYIYQDILYNKFWLIPFGLLILFGLTFFVLLIVGLVKRERNVITILILSILTIVVRETLKSEIFKSEKVLEATLDDDLSSLHLTLRKNNSFQMTSVTMFSNEGFSGNYKLTNDKIIFLDKPYDNDFIPDTVTIIGDKIILQFDSSGNPKTDFATFFSINQNKLQNGP